MKFELIRLTGFKSFVEKTELRIEPGLTGIIGPNGCGKSNLLEALRWVMGETSAKSLRGGGMDDVIFAGSQNRPARNHAEVHLKIDNSDRSAPALFNNDESLEIVRRIEREAGSRYLVNGREVRARDIQTLFADAATGPHSASLVRQGQISQIINAKPKQRRVILEEAAGIAGLHGRRKEAEQRLEAAEGNLERLDDVIRQCEAHGASLKRQARQATRYRELSEEIRRLQAQLYYARWDDIETTYARVSEALEAVETRVRERTDLAAKASRGQLEAADIMPDLRQKEAETTAALQRLVNERDQLDREEKQAEETRASLKNQYTQIVADLEREKRLIEDAAAELSRLHRERTEVEKEAVQADELADAKTALEKHQSSLAETETTYEAATRAEAERQSKETHRAHQQDDLSTRLETLKARIATVMRAIDEHAERSGEMEILPTLRSDVEELQARRSELREAIETATKALNEVRARQTAADKAAAQAEARKGALEAERAAIASFFRETTTGPGRSVIELMQIPAGYEHAVAAALGDDLQATDDPAADHYWGESDGQVGFVELPDGIQALADLIEAPALLQKRLARVGVVDRDQGARLQGRLKPGERLVSTEGDLWRWDGLVRHAEAGQLADRLIESRQRLEALDQQIAETATEIEGHASERDLLEGSIAAENDKVVQARSHLEEVERRFQEDSRKLDRLEHENAAHATRQNELEGQKAEAEKEFASISQRLAKLAEEIAAAAAEPQVQLTELKERVELLRDQAAISRAKVEGLRLEQEAHQARMAAFDRDIEGWQTRRAEALKQVSNLEQRGLKNQEALEELARKPAEIEEKRQVLLEHMSVVEEDRRIAVDAVQTAEQSLRDADRAERDAQNELNRAREDLVRTEAEKEAAKTRREDLLIQIREQLNCSPADLVAMADFHEGQDLPDPDGLDRRLEDAKRRRDELGAVNLRAEEELEAATEELAGYETERDDLRGAINRLRQAISSINDEGRKRILTAFETVNEQFKALFRLLFKGGTAELALIEDDDPLQAGLEIFAKPPGKATQTLSLLSGGEQALTAMALIFAVFRANPAPICVLDEVDAPLDDANVDRFCNLLDEMAHTTETRFIAITHHPLTMSRMDRLYGVTMGERGVSQLVSVDLTRYAPQKAAE